MASTEAGHSARVTQDDEHSAGTPEPAAERRAALERQFHAIVGALRHDDPRFVRRVSRGGIGPFDATDLMIGAGLLATLLLGVLPLALGVQLGLVALLVPGLVGCVAFPVVVPLLVRRLVVRHRPLWA